MKRFALIFVICLSLISTGVIFAEQGSVSGSDTVSIPIALNATVQPYASVRWLFDAFTLRFSGIPDQQRAAGVTALVESNCRINALIKATTFEQGVYSLHTRWFDPYRLRWREADGSWYNLFTNARRGIRLIPIVYQANTGDQISSQAAGVYTATITLTVYES